jgi:hypothetical protein
MIRGVGRISPQAISAVTIAMADIRDADIRPTPPAERAIAIELVADPTHLRTHVETTGAA